MLKRKIHLADLDKTAILPFRTKITKIWDKKLSNTANPSLRTVPKRNALCNLLNGLRLSWVRVKFHACKSYNAIQPRPTYVRLLSHSGLLYPIFM